MVDGHIEVRDTAEVDPQDRAEQRMTQELAACAERAERAAERQVPLRGAVDDLPALVAAAHQAGMPAERIASCARITSEDVRRVLDTGRLYRQRQAFNAGAMSG